jgi:hypothetical protein
MGVKIEFIVRGFLKEEFSADGAYFLFADPDNHDNLWSATPEYLANSLYDIDDILVYSESSDDYPRIVYKNPNKWNLFSKFFPGSWGILVTLFSMYMLSSFTLDHVTFTPLSSGLALVILVTFEILLFLASKYEIYQKFTKFILGKLVMGHSNNRYYISSLCKIIITMDCEDIESGVENIVNLKLNGDPLGMIDQIIVYNDIVISIKKVNQKNLVKLYSAKTRSYFISLPFLILAGYGLVLAGYGLAEFISSNSF